MVDCILRGADMHRRIKLRLGTTGGSSDVLQNMQGTPPEITERV